MVSKNDSPVDALVEACQRLCPYCRSYSKDNERGTPYKNEKGLLVHKVFSSRGLATEHECRALVIQKLADEYEDVLG